ncbi:Flagellar motor switch protein FliN [Tepidimonas fonticaldi]|uniref:Flagellar motor switch protein FliN n=1 Tax=Tepidimonas fonticaldi TaxID=1101373 RepID=A0A1A6DUH6_9BURK|nr:flagellar motor switch protein FliN [Tepidimonas fonticaldi]OBS30445.1 flagellar motor switch protein FliN [Tepidimonas fonticaldi]TSE36662.1 Flagellar motor switch protein FliN [Tepidimonas fonticaldi]
MTNENDTPAGPVDEQALADEWAQALQEQTGGSGGGSDDVFASAPHFDGAAPAPTGNNDISMVLDIPVTLSVELGRTKVPIKYILQLAQGSIVELDALAGEPMDVLVNGYLIAQGEVVVVNEKFGIRLTDIVTPSERLRRLSKH